MSDACFPDYARVVIVVGGVMGCGLAYHLAREGWTDVVLVEKAELTSGSTWHSAGQITHSTSSFGLGKCVGYNIDLYSGRLEAETSQPVTWHGCGSFRLAYSEDEMDWLRHTLSVGRSLGINIELVWPDRVAELHPYYNLEGVIGALHTPDDGHVDPTNVTMALATGARAKGVRIIRRCRAMNIVAAGDGWRVETEKGAITCDHVVNAGGTYARQVGEWSGLQLPMTSMTHHYFVTETVPEYQGLERELPVIRDDAKVSGCIRMEQTRGLIGIYEKSNPNSVWHDDCPWHYENWLFDADYDRVMPWLEESLKRMPVFADLGIQREVHGATSHPPDGNPLIGPALGVRNYWCCCGTQIGNGWGPGLARELARWMVHGSADISMRDFDPRRFGGYATKEWQVVKAHEDYCLRHEIPFPHFNRLAGRPVKTSAIYETLRAKGGVHEEVFGWERPRWFARGDVAQRDHYFFRRTAAHDLVAEELGAVREAAGVMDISSLAKIEVSGADAARVLDGLVANLLPGKDGRIILTHMLNERGRIELELTMVRLPENWFYLTCVAFFEQRLIDWLTRHIPKGADVAIHNQSAEFGALALQGPRARDILQPLTDADLTNAAFPWLTLQNITVAGQPVLAMRMSYAGVLGWALHMFMAHLASVYDALWLKGAALGLRNNGSFAMNAMRMEKGFKGAGELTNEVTLPEADVMRFVRKDRAFLGKEATLATDDLAWICAYLEIEPDGALDGHGGKAVLHQSRVVGSTSSVVFGHTVGMILAFAYIKPAAAAPGTELGVVIAGQPRKARVLAEPAYDPQSLRPRTDAVLEPAQ